MNQFSLQSFINQYGLFTIISAIVISFVIEAVCLIKKDKRLAFLDYLPFFLGILSEIIYGLILFGKDVDLDKFLYAGLLCGSLSEVLKTLASRLLKGKSIKIDYLSLAIEGIISEYVKEDALCAIIKQIIAMLDLADAEVQISKVLSENLKRDVDKENIERLVSLIIMENNSLKQNGKD